MREEFFWAWIVFVIIAGDFVTDGFNRWSALLLVVFGWRLQRGVRHAWSGFEENWKFCWDEESLEVRQNGGLLYQRSWTALEDRVVFSERGVEVPWRILSFLKHVVPLEMVPEELMPLLRERSRFCLGD